MADTVYVPFPKRLYDDVIRYSDGKLDPVDMAVSQLESLIERTMFDDIDWWGDRWDEVAERYTPGQYARWCREQDRFKAVERRKATPLVWKKLTIPAGSEVRMRYQGRDHFAKVVGGEIVDNDGGFSPSQWARKVADRTSRNAWRDLYFRYPGEHDFRSAEIIRSLKDVSDTLSGSDAR